MIDNEKIEKVSHTIDEVLMYISNTYEIEPLLLSSLVLARAARMCDDTQNGIQFRDLCRTVSEVKVEPLQATTDENKVD